MQMTIGQRIRHYRTKKGLTQEELAKILDTTKQNVYKYENGIITNIPINKIEMMAKLFNIKPSELIGWNGETENSASNSSEKPISPPDETSLLSIYRKLNKSGKAKVIDYASDLTKSPVYIDSDRYAIRPIAARGGKGVQHLVVTKEEFEAQEKYLESLPDANDLDYL